jgi:hypothetical protein
MNTAQRKVTVGFGIVIGGVVAWGLGTYLWFYYQDATAPPTVLSERAFLAGLPNLILAAAVSVVLAVLWALCHIQLRGNTDNP